MDIIATLEYALASGLCWIIDILDSFFGVMSGQVQVSYNKQPYYLINVFFENASVRNAYWAMALLGILLCFVFAIIAVAKKAVDAGDKMRQGMGDILTGLFKGIIIIVSLTFIMTMTLDLTNALLQRVTYAFNHSEDNDKPVTITYTDEEYAAMARVLNTIGNYSLNPSYNSRYNINSCFNEIRTDLQFLKEKGAFALHYVTDENNPVSWQSELQKIINATDKSRDLKLDVYDAGVTNAIVSLMKTMQQNSSFAPLQSYERKYVSNSSKVPLDRLIFLMCTMDAAKNPAFNNSPTVGDELRGAYYTGEKSIYNLESVFADFEISKINFIVLIAVAFKLIWDYAVIIINCVARIFNLLLLYLIAPPCIATLPLDEGGKMKQWTTAFVIQCFGVFGTIIAMRVMLLFIPIVIDNNLLLFDNYVLNLMAKVIIILGGIYSGVFTPTESAAVAVVYGLFVAAFIHREMTPSKLFQIIIDAVKGTANILMLIMAATLFGYVLTIYQVPALFTALMSKFITGKYSFLLFLNLLLIVLGMLMDSGAIILIIAPLVYDMAVGFGIDPVQLGCIIVFNLSVGQATPPFGLCLFAAQPVTKQSIGILSRAVFPFVIILYAMVLTTSFIPALSLAIPNLM